MTERELTVVDLTTMQDQHARADVRVRGGVRWELLDQAVAYVEAHPEEYNQGSWGRRTLCGTVGCLAWHVVRVAGADVEISDDGSGPPGWYRYRVTFPDGRTFTNVPDAALYALGADKPWPDDFVGGEIYRRVFFALSLADARDGLARVRSLS